MRIRLMTNIFEQGGANFKKSKEDDVRLFECDNNWYLEPL